MLFYILLDLIQVFLSEGLVLIVILAVIRFSLSIFYSVLKYLFTKKKNI